MTAQTAANPLLAEWNAPFGSPPLGEIRPEHFAVVKSALAAGASTGTVHIVDVEEVPLAYLPSNATRIHVKAVGELELGREIVAPGR